MKITIEYSTSQLERCRDEEALSTFLSMLQDGDIDLSKPTKLRLIDTYPSMGEFQWGTLTVAEE